MPIWLLLITIFAVSVLNGLAIMAAMRLGTRLRRKAELRRRCPACEAAREDFHWR